MHQIRIIVFKSKINKQFLKRGPKPISKHIDKAIYEDYAR